jgi:hypothetical protein
MKTAIALLATCTFLGGQQPRDVFAEQARQSLQGIQCFILVADYVHLPAPLRAVRSQIDADIDARIAASPKLRTALTTFEANKIPNASLWTSIRAKCMDTSATGLPPLPPYKLPPDPPGWQSTLYSTEQQAYIASYKAFALARARAAGERVVPPVCAVTISVALKQNAGSLTTPTLKFPATTWIKEETLVETESDVAARTCISLIHLLDEFAADFAAANPS